MKKEIVLQTEANEELQDRLAIIGKLEDEGTRLKREVGTLEEVVDRYRRALRAHRDGTSQELIQNLQAHIQRLHEELVGFQRRNGELQSEVQGHLRTIGSLQGMINTQEQYKVVLQTAANYEGLSTGERWDYCWEADLSQANWATACLEHLEPCSYLNDLKQLLSLLEAEEDEDEDEELQEEDSF